MADQILHNLENRRRQYGLADRAGQLGWTMIELAGLPVLRKSARLASGGRGPCAGSANFMRLKLVSLGSHRSIDLLNVGPFRSQSFNRALRGCNYLHVCSHRRARVGAERSLIAWRRPTRPRGSRWQPRRGSAQRGPALTPPASADRKVGTTASTFYYGTPIQSDRSVCLPPPSDGVQADHRR